MQPGSRLKPTSCGIRSSDLSTLRGTLEASMQRLRAEQESANDTALQEQHERSAERLRTAKASLAALEEQVAAQDPESARVRADNAQEALRRAKEELQTLRTEAAVLERIPLGSRQG